ncbi:MAG TPA: transketolase C-terminal domain-containing protein [Candidatus Limnocylindria bacterium]
MLTFTAALEEALAEEMRLDPRVFCLGTVPPAALVQEFGAKRVLKTPISETAITGMAIGAAGCGLRPVVLWGNVTFSFVAFDQVVNQAAKIRYMFGGQRDFPIVIRALYGGGLQLAAQHSQSPYSIFAHIAGLKVILPSGPADAKGLLKAAIRDNNPVLCFEGVRLADRQEDVPADHLVPLGSAAVKRAGSDVTVVAFGYMVQLALDAAVELERAGVSVEVVDPRSLVPLDRDTIRSSVRKTGRLVVVDEAPAMCSMASEIAAVVTEDDATFAALRAPIRRVNGAATPVPYSPPLEQAVLPSLTGVITAIREVVRVDAR